MKQPGGEGAGPTYRLPLDVVDKLDNLRDKVAFILDVSATMLRDAKYASYLVEGHRSLARDVMEDFMKIGASHPAP